MGRLTRIFVEKKMEQSLEYSVIVETHTLNEGGDWNRFRAVLKAALGMMPADGSAQVLVADVSGSPELKKILAEAYPTVRRVPAEGLGYDGAKMKAVEAAAGRYILFLDGDCLPAPGWHEHLLAALRSGRVVACGGYTRYEGGFWAALFSVLDFGFLYPRVARDLKCYASNNCGFVREALLAVPMPVVSIRCACYYHAQLFQRRGTPMQLIPEARVLHERQPIIRERSRQGYDTIAAGWVDAELPQARWLRWGMLSLPLFYAINIWRDWERVWLGRKDLGLALWQVGGAFFLLPLLRLMDVAGMVYACLHGPTPGGWGGWLVTYRYSTES
jgi:hypothetical protein